MIYIYDKKIREFRKVNFSKHSTLTLFGVSICATLISVAQVSKLKNKEFSEGEVKLIMSRYNEFSEEKLISKIKELHFKFPHIVLAQAKLESGNFTSKMFNENNNLFGMKEAKSRINTAGGTQNGHAYYDSWGESIYDYALYSSTYLTKIKTEREYFDYLSQSYAEDPNYIKSLQNLIEKENLKSKF
jgi:hypothetical protein